MVDFGDLNPCIKVMKQTCLIQIGFCAALCLILVACSKTGSSKRVSPEAAKQSRLDWDMNTMVGSYERIGKSELEWDGPATNALAEFAHARSQSLEPGEDWVTIIRTNCDAAVQARCDDPMVRYLYIRFAMSQTNSAMDFADAFYKTSDAMMNSSYPPILKFYATLAAIGQLHQAYGGNMNRETMGELTTQLTNNLVKILGDKTTPPEEVYDACHQILETFRGNKQLFDYIYSDAIEKPLSKNWTDASETWLLKGEVAIDQAWQARGGGYADTVTPDGLKLFKQHLASADELLNHAWKLNPTDPRIAVKMMWVELGQSQGRDRMELWFNRAMELDPNDYDACNTKLLYIEPKWYGSVDDMLGFGRECAQNTNWGGSVPLTLVDAHYDICNQYIDQSERTNYWKQPDVWDDIKSAYEQYFQLYPNDASRIPNYAWYAYHAEDWDKLNELIPKLGPASYYAFGGKDEFDKMVQLAKEHASQPAATPP